MENMHNVVFNEGDLEERLLDQKDSTLMAYFKAVKHEADLMVQPNDGRPLAKDLTYVQFCKSFSFTKDKWTRRSRKGNQIGRLYAVFPSAGDKFYLRMLLCQVTFNIKLRQKLYRLITYFLKKFHIISITYLQ